jgi:hypothetical protein
VSPTAAPSSTESGVERVASVAGKVFLLGEYAALTGSPALLAAVGPRFVLRARSSGRGAHLGPPGPASSAASAFHPASPAGRLIERARERLGAGFGFSFWFEDPYRGEGGFGASTAQFALVYGALAEEAGWELSAHAARKLYRELMAGEKLPPSGADLIAQWSGGVVRFDPSRAGGDGIESRAAGLDWGALLVFSAAALPGRKVPTHEHLARLADSPLRPDRVATLAALVDRADRAILSGDGASFGAGLTEYARALSDAGLELAAARADREALASVPGVLGVKGAGALLADAVVVWLAPEATTLGGAERSRVIQAARERGLKLIADGLGPQQAGWVST